MSEKSKKKTTNEPSSLPASPAGEMPEVKDSRWLVPGVCVFLAAIVWVVFGQTLHHEFVNYDDNIHVYDNPAVKSGLTLKSISWAFQFSQKDYWHPLDFLSHMLDCQLYGLAPAGHHLTNVLLHATVAILLFLVLRQMTGLRPDKGVGAAVPPAGALWRSAFVAAVFAIHPLRVESVAWVSERKDVLSGLFFMLTLWAYTRYAQGRSSVESRESSAGSSSLAFDPRLWTLNYCLVLLFFAFGLMSKPTLMTLPFVLLLLDYWPLKRFVPLAAAGDASGTQSAGWRSYRPVVIRLMAEKLPLFMLSAAACVQAAIGNSPAFEINKSLPILLRISNAMVSYVAYIWQMVWPVRLAVVYPFPVEGLPLGEVIGAVILLVLISAVLFNLRQRHPCYLVGWLWYLGMLVPVIGFIQAGDIARADRYTYLPQIGLYLLLTWAAADLCAGWRHRRVVLGGLATVILAALIFCARAQTSYWRNSELLWTHTLACTSGNFVGHNNLGYALFQQGKVDEAMIHYQKALEIKPDYAEAHSNLGNVLFQKGSVDEAIAHCQKALEIKPDFAEAHNNLANALFQKGRVDEAIAHYQTVLQIKPDYAETYNNLGNVLLQKGRVDEAVAQYQQALQIDPNCAEAHINLGNVLLQKGRVDEAITHFQKVLQIKPDSVAVLNNLAWLLATCPDAHARDGVQAVKYAGRACELTHYGATPLVGTLAAAYAEAGRYDDAVATAQKACALAAAAGEQDLLERNRKLLALYRAHQPYHEAAGKFVPAAP